MIRHEVLAAAAAPSRGPVPPVLCLHPDVPLIGGFVERLIAAERAGAHLVLLADTPSDLDAAVAAIARQVVTDDTLTAIEATARYGPERVIHADPQDVASWIDELAIPESMTVRRRIRTTLRRIPGAAALRDLILGAVRARRTRGRKR